MIYEQYVLNWLSNNVMPCSTCPLPWLPSRWSSSWSPGQVCAGVGDDGAQTLLLGLKCGWKAWEEQNWTRGSGSCCCCAAVHRMPRHWGRGPTRRRASWRPCSPPAWPPTPWARWRGRGCPCGRTSWRTTWQTSWRTSRRRRSRAHRPRRPALAEHFCQPPPSPRVSAGALCAGGPWRPWRWGTAAVRSCEPLVLVLDDDHLGGRSREHHHPHRVLGRLGTCSTSYQCTGKKPVNDTKSIVSNLYEVW